MELTDHYFYTIEQDAQAEYKDKGSKFFAYAFPIKDVADFKSKMEDIKKENGKAQHFCFAYKLGADGLQFRAGDDREPSGSAGKPILGQITSKQLTNVAVIVVRYFGGTLLGIPGLIHAYKTAAALALQMVPIQKRQMTTTCQLDFDYTRMSEVMRWIKNLQGEISEQELQLFCKIKVQIPRGAIEEARTVFSDLQGVTFHILK